MKKVQGGKKKEDKDFERQYLSYGGFCGVCGEGLPPYYKDDIDKFGVCKCKDNREYCHLSRRVDGKLHSWYFDGDDPYVICYFCKEVRTALSDTIIRKGN